MPRPFKGTFDKPIKVTPLCPAGILHERLEDGLHGRDERLFRLAWQNMHQGPAYGISTASDLVAGLLTPPARTRQWLFSRAATTARDRVVAATVIQWLGTNVGRCFLREVMEESARLHPILRAFEIATGDWPFLKQPRRSQADLDREDARRRDDELRRFLDMRERRVSL